MGLFQSINRTIKYQPKKANIITDMWAKTQRPIPRIADDPLGPNLTKAMAEVQELEETYMLIGMRGVLCSSRMTKWTMTYQEDAKLN